MNKKIFRFGFIFTLLLAITFGGNMTFAQNNGLGGVLDGFGSGFGLGDNDGNGNADWNDAATNWSEGVGEDVMTDLFGNTGVGPIPDGEFKLPCPDAFNVVGQNTSARKYILNVVNFGLSFLGLLAVVMIIYAGFLYVSDAGSGSGSEKAKKIIQYAIMGILVILGSFAIVNTVIKYAGVGGNDSASSVTSSDGFAGDFDLISSDCEANGFLKKFGEITIDGPGTYAGGDIGSGSVIKIGEPVTFTFDLIDSAILINLFGSDFGSPESYLWTFSNGTYGNQSEEHTFYTEGWHDIGVIVKNAEGETTKAFTKVYVGSPVEARFFSSSLRPKSGDTVEFNAAASVSRLGNIKSYEWTCRKAGRQLGANCFAPDTGQRINKPFYSGALDAEFEVTLKVTSTISPEIYDEVTEIIKVSSGVSPKPEIISAHVTQDPDDDQLFTIKTWVNDPIDNPLKNFRFEVWEGGKKLTQKSSTFGVNVLDASGMTVQNQVPNGYYQTFSEITIDLSAHRGLNKDLRFRTIARNTMGGEDVKDQPMNNVDIGKMNNTPPSGWIQVSPSKVGNKRTIFQFFGMGTDNQSDAIRYEWVIQENTNIVNGVLNETSPIWGNSTTLTGRSLNYNFGDNGTFDHDGDGAFDLDNNGLHDQTGDPITPEKRIERKDYQAKLTMTDPFSVPNELDSFNVYSEIITIANIINPVQAESNNPPVVIDLGCIIDGKITNKGLPGSQIVCTPQTSDPEYHPLTHTWQFSATKLDINNDCEINPTSGEPYYLDPTDPSDGCIAGKYDTSNDVTFDTINMFDNGFVYDFNLTGFYELSLQVEDNPPPPPLFAPGSAEVSNLQTKTIEINAIEVPDNAPPEIQFINISPDPSGGNNTYSDETNFTYSVLAVDPENEPLEYRWCFMGDTYNATNNKCDGTTHGVNTHLSEVISPSFRYKNKFSFNTPDLDEETTEIFGRVFVKEKNRNNWPSESSQVFSVKVGESKFSNSAPMLNDINCKVNNITKPTNSTFDGDFQLICDPLITDDENHPIKYSWSLNDGTNTQTFNDISYFAYDFYSLAQGATQLEYTLTLKAKDLPPNPPYDPNIASLKSKPAIPDITNGDIFEFKITPPTPGQDLPPEIKKIIITPDASKIDTTGVMNYTFDAIAIDPEGEGLEYEWDIEFTKGTGASAITQNKQFKTKTATMDFSLNNFVDFTSIGVENGENQVIDVSLIVTETDDFDGNTQNENSSSTATETFIVSEKDPKNNPFTYDWNCTINGQPIAVNNLNQDFVVKTKDEIKCEPTFYDPDQGQNVRINTWDITRSNCASPTTPLPTETRCHDSHAYTNATPPALITGCLLNSVFNAGDSEENIFEDNDTFNANNKCEQLTLSFFAEDISKTESNANPGDIIFDNTEEKTLKSNTIVFQRDTATPSDYAPVIRELIISPDKNLTSTIDVENFTFNSIATDEDDDNEILEYEWIIGDDLSSYISSFGTAGNTVANIPSISTITTDHEVLTGQQINFDFYQYIKDYTISTFDTSNKNGESQVFDILLIVKEKTGTSEKLFSYKHFTLNVAESNLINTQPIIQEILCTNKGQRIANTSDVTQGTSVECSANAYDSDGHGLTYQWTLYRANTNSSPTTYSIERSNFSPTPTMSFIAEDAILNNMNDYYSIQLTVTDTPPQPLYDHTKTTQAPKASSPKAKHFRIKKRDPRNNTAPKVKIHVYPDQRNSPIEGNTSYSFYAEATDAENDALEYLWDFGDGNTSTFVTPSHDYDPDKDPSTATTGSFFTRVNGNRTTTNLNTNYDGEIGELDVKVTVTEIFNPLIHDTQADRLNSDRVTTTATNTTTATTSPVEATVELKEFDPNNEDPDIIDLGIEGNSMTANPGEFKAFTPEIYDVNADGSPDVIDTFVWEIFKYQQASYTNGVRSWQNINGTILPEKFSTRNINTQFLTEGRYSVYLKATDDEGSAGDIGINSNTAVGILADINNAEVVEVSNNFDNKKPHIKYLNNQAVRSAILDENVTLQPQIFDADYNPQTDDREYQWFIFEGKQNSTQTPVFMTTGNTPTSISYANIQSSNNKPNLFIDFAPSATGLSNTTPNIDLLTPIIFDSTHIIFKNATSTDIFYFDVSLRVIDTKNGIEKEHTRTRKIIVTPANVNKDPEILKIDPSTGYNGAKKNTLVSFIPMTHDQENDQLGYTWTIIDPSGQTAATFNRRNITYTFDQLGDYVIDLEINELYTNKVAPAGTDKKSISTFTVGNKIINNTAPNIFSLGQSPIANQSRENQLNTFNPLVGDAENDVLEYTWEVWDPSGTNVHNATTKSMFFVFDQLGDYDVTLTVIENQAALDAKHGVGLVTAQTATSTETITVNAAPIFANDPPNILHLGLLPSNAGITSQTLFTFNPIVIDPEGDLLTFVWDFGDGVSAYYKDTTHRYDNKGKYKATLTVSDGYNTVSDFIWINVVDPNTPVPHNDPPVITHLTALPSNSGTTEDKFSLFAKAVDPDQDPLTYQWDFDTGAQAFNQNTSYQFTTAGTYDATVTVSDGIHQVHRSLTFQIVDPTVDPPPPTIANLPPIIHSLRPSPGNTGDLRTIFSFHPLVSDPENDPLRYEWRFGNTHRMYSKNVAYRYPMPGNWHTELFVSDGTHTVSKPITIQVVPVGTPIPPSTVTTVYVGQNPSDLDPGDISIATKADLEIKLGDLQAKLGDINAQIETLKEDRADKVEQKENAQQQLIILQNQRDQIIDRLTQLNDPNYVQQVIQDAKDGNALLQSKYALLSQTTDPDERDRLLAEIAAIEAQIEADVMNEIAQEKNDLTNDLAGIDEQIAALIALIDQLDADIFDIDKLLLDLETEANKILAKIKSLDDTLSGDYLIEGTASGEYSSSGTKFFLYGNLPMETNRAIFVEWESGDGRSFVGQDATLRYPEDGLFNAKLIVTDGISTVSDSIGIKIHPRRVPRRRR